MRRNDYVWRVVVDDWPTLPADIHEWVRYLERVTEMEWSAQDALVEWKVFMDGRQKVFRHPSRVKDLAANLAGHGVRCHVERGRIKWEAA